MVTSSHPPSSTSEDKHMTLGPTEQQEGWPLILWHSHSQQVICDSFHFNAQTLTQRQCKEYTGQYILHSLERNIGKLCFNIHMFFTCLWSLLEIWLGAKSSFSIFTEWIGRPVQTNHCHGGCCLKGLQQGRNQTFLLWLNNCYYSKINNWIP